MEFQQRPLKRARLDDHESLRLDDYESLRLGDYESFYDRLQCQMMAIILRSTNNDFIYNVQLLMTRFRNCMEKFNIQNLQ